jgi:glyceraldehyde 3-phosphate dehydrogenase
MMSVRIGINGFGRMGRLGLRAARGRDGLELVRINEIATDAAGSAHLLKFDSVHGVWGPECAGEGDAIRIDDRSIAYSCNPALADTDWSDCDIVIEATGKHHKKPETLRGYFDQGVKKILVAARSQTVKTKSITGAPGSANSAQSLLRRSSVR